MPKNVQPKKDEQSDTEAARRKGDDEAGPAVEPDEEEGSSVTRPGRRDVGEKLDESGAEVE